MKQLAKYLLPLCCGIALASCYGLDKEEYRELAPITVSGLDRTIYAKATETLHLDKLRVESESGQDLVYEWSYGKPAGDFPGMVDTTFISSSPTLDYAFDKAGSYVLRLRIDNGESIGFHYYDLRVQAGFDEGFLILCNDDEGAGSLAFVKKRSPQEEAEGAQEIWDNLLTINPEYDFRSLRDVYVFSSPGYASGILISSGDDEGSIYRLDPVTLSVTYRMKGMDEYGVRTGEILGERTSGTAHWAYLIGDDERAYRYEFSTDMLIVRETPFPARYGGRDCSPRKPPECATSSCSPRPESPDSPIRESRDTPHPTGMNSSTWQRAASGRDSTTLPNTTASPVRSKGRRKPSKSSAPVHRFRVRPKSRPTTRCSRC